MFYIFNVTLYSFVVFSTDITHIYTHRAAFNHNEHPQPSSAPLDTKYNQCRNSSRQSRTNSQTITLIQTRNNHILVIGRWSFSTRPLNESYIPPFCLSYRATTSLTALENISHHGNTLAQIIASGNISRQYPEV